MNTVSYAIGGPSKSRNDATAPIVQSLNFTWLVDETKDDAMPSFAIEVISRYLLSILLYVWGQALTHRQQPKYSIGRH